MNKRYIDRIGLEDIMNFILTEENKYLGLKKLKELNKSGIEIYEGSKIIIQMDSLGYVNTFEICEPSQMTNEECKKTVEILNVILDTNWEFKEKIGEKNGKNSKTK